MPRREQSSLFTAAPLPIAALAEEERIACLRLIRSNNVGPVAFREGEEHPFLGKEYREQREYSEETAREIDSEVQRFLVQAEHRAQKLLSEQRDKLETLTRALVEKESLSEDEMIQVLGQPAPRSDAVLDTPPPVPPI